MAEPRLCPICNKNTLSTPKTTRCFQCYSQRREVDPAFKSEAREYRCIDCGTPCSLRSKRCLQCYRKALRTRTQVAEAASPFTLGDGPPPSTLFDDRWRTFNNWIGRSQKSTPGRKAKRGKERIIFHSTDWHVPFLNEQAFKWALERNTDADTCVIGGDFFNGGAASRFVETEFIQPREEFEQATRLFQMCAQRFEEVYVNLGNHGDRYRRYFGSRVPPYMMFLINHDPIAFIAEGLRKEHGIENIHISKPVLQDLEESRWMTMIGDCAFAHGETSSKVKMRPAEQVARWTRRWTDKLDVVPRVIVQEHNHYGGMTYDHECRAHLIQAPCLSGDHNYQAKADVRGSPNTLGYVRIVQDENGVTDINQSRYYTYEDTDGE
jgi:hypothetical protein